MANRFTTKQLEIAGQFLAARDEQAEFAACTPEQRRALARIDRLYGREIVTPFDNVAEQAKALSK